MVQYRTVDSKRIYELFRGNIGDYRIETILVTYFKGKVVYILIIYIFYSKKFEYLKLL